MDWVTLEDRFKRTKFALAALEVSMYNKIGKKSVDETAVFKRILKEI